MAISHENVSNTLAIMKNYKFLSIILFVGILIFGACKTDPKSALSEANSDEKLTITTRLRSEPDHLHPFMTWRGWSIHVNNHMFLPLMEYEPEKLILEPILVKSRPQVTEIMDGDFKGGRKYTYEILEEATWDNGQPILASDYEFTVKAVMNPKTGGAAEVFRSVLNIIKDVEIDPENPKKFTVTVFPFSFRGEYTSGAFGILPESIYDPEGLMRPFAFKDLIDPEKSKKLVSENPALEEFGKQFASVKYSRDVVSGAGAYALEEWTTGQQIVLKRKKDWWGDKLKDRYSMLTANPDKIVFKFIPDVNATISLMRNGGIDIAKDIPNSLYKELEQDPTFTKDIQLLSPDSYVTAFVVTNTSNPKLTDKRVRRALAHLFDYDEIIKTVKRNMAVQISVMVPPAVSFHNKDLPLINMDVEKAKALLKEAGWVDSNQDGIVDKVIDGQREEMVLNYMLSPSSDVSTNVALIFQNVAKKAGVEVKLDVIETNAFRDKLKKRTFDLYTAGARIDRNSYDPYQEWHSTSNNPNGSNRSGFGSPESDEIIEKIRTTVDDGERTKLFLRLQEMIYDEQPVIYIYNTKEAIAYNKRLTNVKPSLKSPGYFENYFKLNKIKVPN